MAPLRSSACAAAAVAAAHLHAICDPTTLRAPEKASASPATVVVARSIETVETSSSFRCLQLVDASSSPPPETAGVRVLATRELLELITDFMRGVPRLLTDFPAASASRTSSRHSLTACTSRALSPFVDDSDDNVEWSACYDPQAANGAIPRMALEQDDRRVLAMVVRLHQFPVYRRMRKLRLDMVVRWSVELGRLETLKWLRPRLLDWNALVTRPRLAAAAAATPMSLIDAAVTNGDVPMMAWLQRNCPPESCRVTSEAVALAPVDQVAAVLQWLLTNGSASVVTHEVVTGLAARGCLQALELVHKTLPTLQAARAFSAATMDAAASAGHLEVVAFLHAQRQEGCTAAAMDDAARHGRLDLVRFLHTHRAEGCTRSAMDAAAASGHLAVVAFLHSQRREGCTVAAVDAAACNGHAEVVRFLLARRREGCTFAAMEQAALNGHATIVRFLHRWRRGDERAACTPQAMDNAASGGHLEIVRFLHEKRREGCTTKAMDLAAHNGHLDVVQFLHEHRREGCTRAAMNLAASAGRLDVVRFLHANRSEGCTKRALSMAARNGFAPVVRFLVENRSEGCAEDALRCAYRSGRFEVARYLHARGFMGNVAKCVVSCCCSAIIQYS